MASKDAEKAQMKELWTNLMTADGDKDAVELEKLDLHLDESSSAQNFAVEDKKSEHNVNNVDMSLKANQYTWDVCFVFDVGVPDKTIKVRDAEGKKKKVPQTEVFEDQLQAVLEALEFARLKYDCYYSVQKDEVYVRVGASEKRLQEEADRTAYDLELNESQLLEAAKILRTPLAIATEEEDDLDESVWFHLFGEYQQLDIKRPFVQEVYNVYDDDERRPKSVFSSTDRIKLTVSIIEADAPLGGAGISMSKAISNAHGPHAMLAFFPLHENEKLDRLKTKWRKFSATYYAPLQDIRDYFGESVALYFAFLCFYNWALLPMALIGLVFAIWQFADGRVDVEGLPVLTLAIAIWATVFLEMWKRNEARYRVRWGMTKFQQKEQPRPEFKGEWRRSRITGHKEEYFDWRVQLKRVLTSQLVIWQLIFVVIASVIGTFFLRVVLTEWDSTLGGIFTGIINAIQIQVLNIVYGIVSFKLNDWENHRTDTEYINALISKTFLFKFVNSYNSLFYIAFIKKHDDNVNACRGADDDGKNDCMPELQQQLGTIFISLIVINNVLEVVIPSIKAKLAAKANVATDDTGAEIEKTIPEEEFELESYEGTFDDFDELIIQYGFVTLFVVAFPLAPLLAVINNIIETQVDATKLLQLTRRPEPRGAYDIGTWSTILEIMSYIAVITNVGILTFQTELMDDWTDDNEAWKAYLFITIEHVLFLMKFAIAYFVDDEPRDVAEHILRQDYIVGVVIKNVQDQDDDDDDDDDDLDDEENVAFGGRKIADGLIAQNIRTDGRAL